MHHSFSDIEHPDRYFIHFNSESHTPVVWVPLKFPRFSEEGKANAADSTYIRPKKVIVEQMDTRIDLKSGDSFTELLTKYAEYKGKTDDPNLVTDGLSLLGERV
jgi:hypothetical protein